MLHERRQRPGKKANKEVVSSSFCYRKVTTNIRLIQANLYVIQHILLLFHNRQRRNKKKDKRSTRERSEEPEGRGRPPSQHNQRARGHNKMRTRDQREEAERRGRKPRLPADNGRPAQI